MHRQATLPNQQRITGSAPFSCSPKVQQMAVGSLSASAGSKFHVCVAPTRKSTIQAHQHKAAAQQVAGGGPCTRHNSSGAPPEFSKRKTRRSTGFRASHKPCQELTQHSGAVAARASSKLSDNHARRAVACDAAGPVSRRSAGLRGLALLAAVPLIAGCAPAGAHAASAEEDLLQRVLEPSGKVGINKYYGGRWGGEGWVA